MPHGGRLNSFNAGPTLFNAEETGHSRAKQRLHCVTYRSHRDNFYRVEQRRTSALTYDFSPFPNFQYLELQHAYFHTPAARYLSLRRLKLDHCSVRLLLRPSCSYNLHGPQRSQVAIVPKSGDAALNLLLVRPRSEFT